MLTIESITVKAIPDELSDTSDLGKYTDAAEPWAICRHCGQYIHDAEKFDRILEDLDSTLCDIGNRINWWEEGSYYGPERVRFEVIYEALGLVIAKFETKKHDCQHYSREFNYFKPYAGGEKEGTANYQTYGMQDFKRAEALNRGDWNYIGIMAEATIRNGDRIHTFTSGGLWGIESDAAEYHKEVAQEELVDLKQQLIDFGVCLDNWNELTDGIEVDYE